jgi:hypothetical protein
LKAGFVAFSGALIKTFEHHGGKHQWDVSIADVKTVFRVCDLVTIEKLTDLMLVWKLGPGALRTANALRQTRFAGPHSAHLQH